jgi:hypothetical protein
MLAVERHLAEQLEENHALKEEKERMLAQVVILESKLKTVSQANSEKRPETMPSGPNPKNETVDSATGDNGAPVEKNAKKIGKQPQNRETSDVKPAIVNPGNITTENLVVCREPDSNLLRVEFKVMNVGPKGTPVSGRAVIVLKGDDMDPAQWIVLPDVPLLDHKPEGSRGKPFRIYNYRTLKFKVATSASPDQFAYACIYTYTADGEMLMERDYPLKLSTSCP